MFKLDLEKAEEPEIKLPTSVGPLKKTREFQKNICFIDYAKAVDCMDGNKLCEILKEMGIPDHLTCLLRNLYTGQDRWYSGKESASHCRFLSWEDPLEEGMATHSSILAWKILWTEEPGVLQCIGSQRVTHN